MAEVSAAELGERIREERERLGLSQGDLGERVNLERSMVGKIEAGIRRVTAIELSDIARVLGVRMASFFEPPIPALVSHRSSQGLEVADSRIDRVLASLADDVDLVTSLPGGLSVHVPETYPLEPPESMSKADLLAGYIRLEEGLRGPLNDLVGFAAGLGLFAFSQNFGVDSADAGTILLKRGGVCLVNSQAALGRRRLALAHEIGHYLIADEYTVDWRVASTSSSDIEALLDRFARTLLLPGEDLTTSWSSLQERDYDLREIAVLLASEYRVDMSTLARRLREIGLVDESDAGTIRTYRTTQTDIVDHGLVIPHDLEDVTVPPAYAQAVLRLVRAERISRERALGLLHGTFEEDDLPPVRIRGEEEIWSVVS
jgi:Zn-dependent peptidase ImmA (M78 family)/DNA-binding XRE family transcriptional regulator